MLQFLQLKQEKGFYALSTEYCSLLPSQRHMPWHFFIEQRVTFCKLFAKFCYGAQSCAVKTPLSSTTSENNIQTPSSLRTFQKFIKSSLPLKNSNKPNQTPNQDRSRRWNKFKDLEHCYTSNRSTYRLKITANYVNIGFPR